MKKVELLVIFLVLGGAALFGQSDVKYPRGAILDEAAYRTLPRKEQLPTRSYEGLPKAFSLKQYAPLPGDQTDYGTCVAWASAYAARTISESFALGRKNQTETTQQVFSPVYVYRNIRPDDPECRRGAQISWALDLMKEQGAVKMIDAERSADFPRVNLALYRDSRRYPIANYVTLFDKDDRYKPGLVTRIVKKSLSEGKPVIIGMNTPESFMEARDIWRPRESPDDYYGGHAMCVIGYDDERGGGAFEIMNSWGRKWGNGGFIWIPYQAFIDFVMESYEMIENLAVYSDTVRFAGSAGVDVFSASAVNSAPLTSVGNGVFKTAALSAGAGFRLSAAAGESAYLYCFAASASPRGVFSSAQQLFPPAGVSALLNPGDGAARIPAENKTFSLDNSPGTEYFVLLFAKEELNLRDLLRAFERAGGTASERLAAALGSRLLWVRAPGAPAGAVSFALETRDPKAVAALIVEIEHR